MSPPRLAISDEHRFLLLLIVLFPLCSLSRRSVRRRPLPRSRSPAPTHMTDIPSNKRRRTTPPDAPPPVDPPQLPLDPRAFDDAFAALTENKSMSVPEAILRLLRSSDCARQDLMDVLSRRELNVSFSKVTMADLGPYMHIEPPNVFGIRKLACFPVHRARLPLRVAERCVAVYNDAIAEYGTVPDQANEEARSRVFERMFGPVIALFQSQIRNVPERMMDGAVTTQGRVEHLYEVFGQVAIVTMEMKYDFAGVQYEDAVAQLLAECDACVLQNSRKGYQLPVYGILSNGNRCEFFRCASYDQNRDGTTDPFSDDPFDGKCPLEHGEISWKAPVYRNHPVRRLLLGDVDDIGVDEFLKNLREAVEAVYYILLMGFHNALRAYFEASERRAKREGSGTRTSTGAWHQSASLVQQALDLAVQAHRTNHSGDTAGAQAEAEQGVELLQRCISELPDNVRIERAPDLMAHRDAAAFAAY